MSAIETLRQQAGLQLWDNRSQTGLKEWLGQKATPVPETLPMREGDELGRISQTPSAAHWHRSQNDRFEVKLQAKLDSYERLMEGWDGYTAVPPSVESTSNARRVLRLLSVACLKPSNIAPSVVGGIGITVRTGRKKAYIECYNNGTIYLLLSDGHSEPFATQAGANNKLIIDIEDYLDATTAEAPAEK